MKYSTRKESVGRIHSVSFVLSMIGRGNPDMVANHKFLIKVNTQNKTSEFLSG